MLTPPSLPRAASRCSLSSRARTSAPSRSMRQWISSPAFVRYVPGSRTSVVTCGLPHLRRLAGTEQRLEGDTTRGEPVMLCIDTDAIAVSGGAVAEHDAADAVARRCGEVTRI